MLTVFDALTYAGEELKAAQSLQQLSPQNPKLDAQVLLSHCLKKPTSYLFAHGDEPLSSEVADVFLKMVARRAKHEPVAYILGEKEFFKRPFRVSSATLVPRPETELLIELALENARPGTVFADIGTGSGAIAVTLAKESGGFVFATDISNEALNVAKENAKQHGVSDRIFFLEGDILMPFLEDLKEWMHRASLKHMTIVANLPYLSPRQWEGLDPDVKIHEPKTALVGGIDGLELYERLLKQLSINRSAFPPSLKLLFEIDPSQELSGPSLIKHYFPNASVNVIYDLSHRPRIIEIEKI